MASLPFCWLFLAQALPVFWGAEYFRTQAEFLHFHSAQSWGRQQDLLYMEHLPPVDLGAPSSLLPALWEKYALFDLLRESASRELEVYANAHKPSYRSSLANFYAAKYAFLRHQYVEALNYFGTIKTEDLPKLLREEKRFMEGYAAYATGDKNRALNELRPLAEKVGPFHDAANYYLGVISFERGDWRSAASYFEAVQTRSPYNEQAPLWLAYALSQIPDLTRLKDWAERWYGQQLAQEDTLWRIVVISFAKAGWCEEAFRFAVKVTHDPLVQLWQGICAYRQKKDSLALAFWEPLQMGTDTIAYWALYGSALALKNLRRHEEALSLLNKIPLFPSSPSLEAQWLRAQISWQLQAFSTGKEALNALLLLSPPSPKKIEIYKWLAEFHAAEQEYTEAIQLLDSLPPSTSIEAKQRFLLSAGLEAFKQKNFSAAESLFSKGAHLQGLHTPTLLFWQAEAAYKTGQLARAITLYKQFLAHPKSTENPYYTEAKLAIAWTHLHLSQPDETLRYVEPLRKSSVRDVRERALFLSASALYIKKRYEEALAFYEELLRLNPSPQVRYHVAQTLIRLERYEEAEAVLRTISPTSVGAEDALYLRVELCAVWLHRPECTKEAAQTLLQHFPSSKWVAPAKARLGLALAELNQKESAIRLLLQTLQAYPAHIEASKLALEGLRHLLSPSMYDSVYQAFLRSLPPESETRLNFERERMRQLAEAERWESLQQEAINLRLRYPALTGESLYWQALATEKQGDTARAIMLYQELSYYAAYANQAWEKLSHLYLGQGRLSEAWAAQDSFLRYLPPTGYLRLQGILTWAEIATLLNRGDTAIKVCLALLQDTLLNPYTRQRILLRLALTAEKVGNSDSALYLLRQIPPLDKNALAAEALYHQARLLYEKGRIQESRAAIYQLRDEMPTYTEPRAKAYLILAKIFLSENKRKSARQLLESLVENAPTPSTRQEAKKMLDSLPPLPPPSPTPKPKKQKGQPSKRK
ncbi:MAG: tetratricopeptide repeat protein [Bacteroidia bacterium]|nr:tetratricopeptide repeat protein [Bacteroidia bacterium]MDW8134697.1 tetratricopeptide repeat protein [Bacteroidia bacterium]